MSLWTNKRLVRGQRSIWLWTHESVFGRKSRIHRLFMSKICILNVKTLYIQKFTVTSWCSAKTLFWKLFNTKMCRRRRGDCDHDVSYLVRYWRRWSWNCSDSAVLRYPLAASLCPLQLKYQEIFYHNNKETGLWVYGGKTNHRWWIN